MVFESISGEEYWSVLLLLAIIGCYQLAICYTLGDLISFVQFKKGENTYRGVLLSVLFY